MKQSAVVKLPYSLHAQLKNLAAARGVTMVDLVHGIVRQAIESGELPDETPGIGVGILLDLDAEDHGPFVRITAPAGTFPLMTYEEAELVARNLKDVKPGEGDVVRTVLAERGRIEVQNVGTGVALIGSPREEGESVRIVMTPALVRDLARQIENVTQGAVANAA